MPLPSLPSRDKPGSDAAWAAFYALGILERSLWHDVEARCTHDAVFAARVRAWETRAESLDSNETVAVAPTAALWDRIAARLDDVPGPQTSRPLAWRELAQGVAQADLVCDASGAWMSGLLWLVRGARMPAALDGMPFVSFPIDGQASAGLPADQETLLYIRR